MDEFTNKPHFREKFKSGFLGVMRFNFFKEELRVEGRINRKLIWGFSISIAVAAVIFSVVLFIATSKPISFAAMGLLIFCPLPFLEYNEKITIDSQGIVTEGVVWPRPCKLTWTEIDRIADIENGLVGYCVYIYKKNAEGKEKVRILIPHSQEISYTVAHYYNNRFKSGA